MKKGIYTLIMLLFVLIFSVQSTRAQGSNNKREYSVNLSVREKGTQESVMMATVSMKPLEAITVTDVDGKATIHNVPYGNYTIEISYVGFEKFTTTVLVNKNLNLSIQLTPTSLALKEVVVTAKQKSSGASTTTLIERQAIDHLQATSLADVMQLIPGMKMGNTDMTQQSNLQLR
ncbi:MAG: carboxypeptidase-like regulatory domain-containing protein, partial [Prevotella sp.]|nr:carboxypeptidase-like regulatory domain-containing protein [Prevotella sp.]